MSEKNFNWRCGVSTSVNGFLKLKIAFIGIPLSSSNTQVPTCNTTGNQDTAGDPGADQDALGHPNQTPHHGETPQLSHSNRPTPHQDPTLPLRRPRPGNALHYQERYSTRVRPTVPIQASMHPSTDTENNL